MEEIERSNERCIFLIQNQNISYYIVIPMTVQLSILLSPMDNVDKEKIKGLPLLKDKVIVVPIMNAGMVNYLKTPQASYEQAMNYFAGLINNVSGLLQRNQRRVDPVVVLNNSKDFANFNEYFVKRIPGRIKVSDQDLLIREEPNMLNNLPFGQSVVGSDIPVNVGVDLNNEVIGTNNLETEKGMTKTLKKEPGFVSYVLLGVVSAILSLVFLYMLL